MMGYNAMERQQERLANTPVMDGASAADVLYSNPNSINHPLGSNAVTMNEGLAGQSVRDAKGEDGWSPSAIAGAVAQFEALKEQERKNDESLQSLPEDQIDAITGARAAKRWTELYAGMPVLSEVQRYLPRDTEEVDTSVETPILENTPETDLPTELPDGEKLVKDNGDGTSTWITPEGEEVIMLNSDAVMASKLGASALSSPKPPSSGMSSK
jgi:hypothetical protein